MRFLTSKLLKPKKRLISCYKNKRDAEESIKRLLRRVDSFKYIRKRRAKRTRGSKPRSSQSSGK
jgi:hypothetical protein